MSVSQQVRPGKRGWLSLPLAAALIALAWGLGGAGAVQADGTGPRLALNAAGDGVSCDDPAEPSECVVPIGATFSLSIDMVDPPAEGYVAFNTQVSFPGLTWVPAAASDENVWPDNAVPARSPEPPSAMAKLVSHGGITGTSSFPPSDHEGALVRITLTCSAEEDDFEIALINYDAAISPLGASYALEDLVIVPGKTVDERDVELYGDGVLVTVPVSDLLDISCQDVPPTPTEGPAAEATATPALPPLGYGASDGGRSPGPWLIVGLLVTTAAVLGLSGWRFARRRA